MVQRRASTQSPASPIPGRRSASVGGNLRRSSSSGSMTARSFREPSPHRPSTSSGPINHTPTDVPPLPSLPSQYVNGKPPNRRAVSVQPQMRTPPASPPRATARGVSADRGGREGGSAVNSAHNRLSSLGTVPEMDRPSSRSSINFSRPISPPVVQENRPVGRDASAACVVPAAATGAQHSPSQVSDKSSKTKPRSYGAGNAEKNAIKSVGAPAGTAAAAAKAVSMQKGSPRAEPAHARAERIDPEPLVTSTRDQRSDDDVPVDFTRPSVEDQSSQTIERWPSTVIEEKEPAEEQVDAPGVVGTGDRSATASPTIDHAETVSTPQPSPKGDKESSLQQPEHVRQSSSPGRSAHFSKWLSVSAAGDQVHQPPPRSVSPVKSALKSPRGDSLSPDRGARVGRSVQPSSEMSDGTSVASDDGPRPVSRKKPVKVSFDDEAEVVGIAASPPTSPEDYVPDSPQGKSKSRKGWFGVGKKKPASDFVTGDDDFDKVMKPRPALPSFGSVRKNRDGSQVPVVPEYSDNESSTTSGDEAPDRGVSFSNDHALGGMLAEVHPAEPPQVHNVKTVEQLSVDGEPSSSQEPSADVKMDGIAKDGLSEQPPFSEESESAVPSIAIQPATPMLENERPSFDQSRSSRGSLEQYRIPGGFPPSNSDRSPKSTAEGVKQPMASAEGVKQPMASAVPKLDDVDTEGESGDSIYSDAEEDLEGDGFGSINAIVDNRAIPRSSVPLEPISESRDITPKPHTRTAAIDNQSQDVTDQAVEEVRSITPTQESVNRQMKDSPTAASFPESPSPSATSKSETRASGNGPIQSGAKQERIVSVDAYGSSGLQDHRHSNVNGAASGKTKNRPVSLGPAFQMKGPAAFPSSLRRNASNGSDSSSSFKRSSPSPRNEGSHSMRRTMRGAGPTSNQVQSPTARAGSPEEYRPVSSGSGAGTMRKTLRGPPGGGERTSFFSTNKKAPPRARFTKAPPKSKGATRFVNSDDEDAPRAQVFRSRFADSSDEGEGNNNAMRPVRGIPRRKGARDGDSTDLDDSSEEERQHQAPLAVTPRVGAKPPGSRDKNAPPNMSGMAAVARQRGMSQRELEEFIMQPNRGRKPGLLTRLGLKKPKSADNRISKADVESPSRRDTPLERSRLEREQLREPFAGESTYTTTIEAEPPSSPSSPKVLKKNKRHTYAGDSWPLRPAVQEEQPAPAPENIQSAPTSPLQTEKPAPPVDGAPKDSIPVNGDNSVKETEPSPAGPEFNDASSDITNATDPGPAARNVVIAGSGRKRRFPMLRKAFGLRS